MKRIPLELAICVLLYVAACLAVLIAAPSAHGQQPYAPPVQYAVVGYQPVVMPGYWLPAPRPTWIGNALFGPRYYFYPAPQPPAPLPAAPQR